jgi:hypothetical protein
LHTIFALLPPSVNHLSDLFYHLQVHGTTVAVVVMRSVPPRTPPIVGARRKLLPRPVESFRPAEEDGPPDDVEEVEGIVFVVFEEYRTGLGTGGPTV